MALTRNKTNQIRFHYIFDLWSKMYWKLILKSLRFGILLISLQTTKAPDTYAAIFNTEYSTVHVLKFYIINSYPWRINQLLIYMNTLCHVYFCSHEYIVSCIFHFSTHKVSCIFCTHELFLSCIFLHLYNKQNSWSRLSVCTGSSSDTDMSIYAIILRCLNNCKSCGSCPNKS